MIKSAIILAAGEGKRMKSKKPKVMAEVLFKPMVKWVYDAVKKSGIDDICMVTGYGRDYVETFFGESVCYAVQEIQLGTGHAVMCANDFLENHRDGDILILAGDAPLITPETISKSYDLHHGQDAVATIIAAPLDNPKGYGRILRTKDGSVTGIVEEKDATDEQKLIKEVNSGTYWFKAEALISALKNITNQNAQGEYYLTDTISEILSDNGKVLAYTGATGDEISGANDRLQLLALNQKANAAILNKHMANGVSVVDASGMLIGPDVEIGNDTVLLAGTILRGKTVIGNDCVIGPNSLLENATIGDGVTVNSSQIFESSVGNGTRVGPFSYIRPNCRLGENVKIGDFVELKNSNIDDKTSVAHLTYIGDSDVGKRVNFGCGTVTVNYDGKKKYRTTIKDHAFIGCNTNLIAPVTVGENAYTAAGSTINRNVPDNALAIAREKQTNKEGWVIRQEEKQ